ncbi:hypothetical protein [Paraburkholderia sp. MM5477-R1]|uniref:hypothetical protein n=1 Tax=Paraburkholderia sp. MM5477-R1 TaxID=2991062 RepID=UPI003D207BC6
MLVLSYARVEIAAATPDFTELQHAGLVRVVGTQFKLTDAGRAVLHRLRTR